jgi:amino acid adenylation domain-containing protein
MRPVGVGVAGELYIGGDGVTRGYLNGQELTAERFVPDAFGGEPGARLYRTGDLARYLADGRIEFIGRRDQQVKIRGFRIEPGEVESALRTHGAVRECVVLAREDEPGNKQLVAYVVAASGSQPSASELRDHLRQRLPEYCIPSAVIVLDELPLTSNGKVNRHALPAPNDVRDESWSDYVAPRTPAEEMLAGIWAEVLRVERVGVSDNFFDLGGHSLLATQLISRVREAFRIEIPLRQLFDAPALGDFAGAVEEMRGDGGSRAAPPLVRVSREQSLPLSFAQQRLWFLNQLEPRSAFYNVPLALKLSGRLDLHALERTLGEIVRRHEVLRTSFAVADGQPTQVVGPAAPVPLRLVDLSGMEREERARRAQEEIAAEAQQPFDLGRGPLLRALVVKLEDEEHAGVFTLHHIVSDGWSLGVLVREVATLYEAYMAGQESPFEELAVQYADYAYWQRHWLQGEVLERQLNYWKRQLRGAPALLDLPTDRPRPPMQTHHGARRSFALSLDLTNSLKALSRHQGTTLYMTLLAAFQTLLSRYSGQQDISVGSPIANRHRGETETLIGFFVNTLVLRTELSGDPRFTELLARVREVCLGAYSHQDVPFERLIEELQPERSLSHSPLFQVMFALQNAPSEVLELPGLRLNPFSARTLTAKFELTLSLAESPEGLVGAVEYNTDLFDDDTIARMMRHFERLLEGIVIEPEQRLSELPLLTNDERQQLLIEWNDTEADFPTNICLHELFEQQAARTPEHIAVIFEDQRLTYQQLNERASQLARHLHGLGVGPEVRVAIMVERSVEMVLAVLAVLKAGGAYVPLDPAYPSERLRFMLEDSQARVLLTKSHLAGLLDAGSAQVVWMDAEGAQSARTLAGQAASSSVAPSAGTVAENLAYVIYTSGSTGTPKGVAITHRSAAALLSWAYTRFSAESLAVVLASTSLCFDLSIFELFAPLCSGGTCLVVNDALQLPVLGGESGVTLINTVPSAMAELVRADALPASVQVVNLAGEALTAQLASNVYAVQPAVREVFNLYGPTEDTTYSTWALVERAGAEGREPAIGRPVANTRAYVLDERMEVVAEGVRGELYLSGEGLARGYLNRPELTAARFVPDPFAREPGGRLYRTGDVVRWHKQQLYYVGRADAQVKVRGFRIELGEVESALREHEGVDEACVVLREAAGGDDKRLVAYLVGRGEQRPEVSELRAFLQGKLPDYMVPSQFVTLAALPLTPNGKVDRRALPAPDSSRSVLSAHSVAPRTAAEQVVASIFARVLGVGEVGVTDNFFELGGHSLLATRVMSRVGKVFQVGVALRQLFEWPTVEGVVAALGQQWGDSVVVEDIAQTFIEVGGMSGENVEVMLAQMKTSARN